MANNKKYGYIDFSPLWGLLEKKGIDKQWLEDNGINSDIVEKLSKNENVMIDVICKLCGLLKCQPADIMEFKKK